MTTIKEFLSKHISNRFGEEFSKLFANVNDDIHDDYSDYVCFIRLNTTVTYNTYFLRAICEDVIEFDKDQYDAWLDDNEKYDHDCYKARVEYITELVDSDALNDFDDQYAELVDKQGHKLSKVYDDSYNTDELEADYPAYEKGNDDLMIKEIISELKKSDLSYLR
ncbi:hypothetical protein [Lactobacillus crispatus]|uniref:hypothetical protein n=1 Tax=Lactobacillus crispatus TaxID=47770 RepID=UPI0030FB7F00